MKWQDAKPTELGFIWVQGKKDTQTIETVAFQGDNGFVFPSGDIEAEFRACEQIKYCFIPSPTD